jgi:DNA-binding transcriptional ArsR family regulator
MVSKALEALRRLGKGGRGVEDSVSYSLGHRIRIEILAALHEGMATASRLAEIVHQPLSTVEHHIKEMLKDGSIEIARTEKVGNLDQNHYCMVELPFFSDEDVVAMTEEERQALAGLIVQAVSAEALASLWAGKMVRDPRVMLAWNRANLDRQGRDEMADEDAESWERKEEIEARSTNRRAKTGEPAVTYVIVALSFERSRTSAPDPLDGNHPAPGENPGAGNSPTPGDD